MDRPSQKYFNACSTGNAATVGAFLEKGVSPDARDGYGLTGLIWAGRKGRIEVADVLLARGAAIDAVDRRGRTALYHAVMFKRYDCVRHLASRGASVSPVDIHGCTPLDFAEVSGDSKMVGVLMELGATSTRARVNLTLRRESASRLQNNEMKRTSRGLNEGSPLISVSDLIEARRAQHAAPRIPNRERACPAREAAGE